MSELPVKPLCFPSKESIIAALYPEDNEFTYYALNTSRDGTHRFTADENEYNAWIEELNSVEPDGEQP